MGRTTLGSSRPWRTRISLHTLSSFPFTFFFGMAFSATSRVTVTAAVAVAARVREESEVVEEDLEEGSVEERVAVRRSVVLHWSGGTCHVAR
jgi:hypothetical protein